MQAKFILALDGTNSGKHFEMSNNSETAERSVLDEIRSTIASLDALRGRMPGDAASAVRRNAPSIVPPSFKAEVPESVFDTVLISPVTERSAFASSENGRLAEVTPAQAVVSSVSTTSRGTKPQDVESVKNERAHEPSDSDVQLESDSSPRMTDRIIIRKTNVDAKIMIVDDERLNIMTFRQHLKGEGYTNFVTTERASEALLLVRNEQPDILLLDIHMPQISGLDILRVMGLDPVMQHIPVLILTAATDPKIRKRALDLGASDFLAKPVDPNELIPRVRNAILLKKHFDMVANEAARLEQQVEHRTQQLEATRQQLILSLARAAEHRDNDTGNHVIRVGRYAAIIASAMGYPKNKLQMFEQAAQLHDVGKIGIPDSILFKPGKLDRDQYELMKRHCCIGKRIIEPISEKEWQVLKTHTRKGENLLHMRSSPLLMLAARIAQTHHEKWDGSGYPLGLSGEDIPLEGRIVAVADVFDALSSERPYKEAFPRVKCFEILEEGRGRHFDPNVLDAFFSMSKEIVETQLLLMDDQSNSLHDVDTWLEDIEDE